MVWSDARIDAKGEVVAPNFGRSGVCVGVCVEREGEREGERVRVRVRAHEIYFVLVCTREIQK